MDTRPPATYIADSDDTWADVAQFSNLSVSQLQELNGTDAPLENGQVVLLRKPE